MAIGKSAFLVSLSVNLLFASSQVTVEAQDLLKADSIKVIYPPSGSNISSPRTFVVGAVSSNAQKLTVDGKAVRVNKDGFYAQVVPLKFGLNKIELELTGEGENGPKTTREVNVNREEPTPVLSADKLVLDTHGAEPREDLGVSVAEFVEFAVRATPGAKVTAHIKGLVVPLYPASAVNRGQNAAYGKIYQRFPAHRKDNYVGFYRVQASDKWQSVRPLFVATKAGKSVRAYAPGFVSTVLQPTVAVTKHNPTVVRVGPNLGRTTPLDEGVRVLTDGYFGSQVRILYAANNHRWIAREDLEFERESGEAPQAVARTIESNVDEYGDQVIVPLNQRLPYEIEQHLNPNRLVLKLYGVTSDTDWANTQAPSVSRTMVVDKIGFKQQGDGLYEVLVDLKGSRQWGFWAGYETATGNLILHVKKAPSITTVEDPSGAKKRLVGLSICVDPGHGGREKGSIGCSGLKESSLNLAIAMSLKRLLEAEGARVVMTRSTDVDVSLSDRPQVAFAYKTDILLSIHNNSLPDGADPVADRGTSSYYYHPQSIEFARLLCKNVVNKTGFPDFGTRWQNLALTRPSAMLASLVEVGFMVNPDEFSELIRPEVQEKAARGMLNAIVEYLETARKPEQPEEAQESK